MTGIRPDDCFLGNGLEPLENKERRLEELKLLHTWITATAATVPSAEAPIVHETWARDVPGIALDHHPLLYAILSFAAFHLSVLEPHNALKNICTARRYLHLCIRHHNAAVALLSRENADQVALTCLLLSVLKFRDLDYLADGPRGPEQSLNIASSLTQRFMLSHTAGQRFRDAWTFIKDDNKALSTIIVKGSPLYRETGQLRIDPSDGRLTWPREFGDAFKHLLDPNNMTGPLEASITDAGPMTEELWDPEIRGCYEEVLNHIGAIHSAIQRKEESALTICRRITAFPCLLPRKFFDLLQDGRPRALVILAQFFAAAKAVDDVWWVGDAGRTEVHAIWESLDERWKRQMGEALRMVHAGRE